jgi:hypothetical protein
VAREAVPLSGEPVTNKDMLKGMLTYIWPKVCLYFQENEGKYCVTN